MLAVVLTLLHIYLFRRVFDRSLFLPVIGQGCMVIRPWGMAIWDAFKDDMDKVCGRVQQ